NAPGRCRSRSGGGPRRAGRGCAGCSRSVRGGRGRTGSSGFYSSQGRCVRDMGLESSHPLALEPKSSTYANSALRAPAQPNRRTGLRPAPVGSGRLPHHDPSGVPMSALAGKTAVNTGSSRGVGAATAKLLAGEGANVVINYRQKAPRANKVVAEIETAGGRAVAVGADLTDPEDVRTLMRTAIDSFGSLDLLSLNASG